jgi:hypothetical protein
LFGDQYLGFQPPGNLDRPVNGAGKEGCLAESGALRAGIILAQETVISVLLAQLSRHGPAVPRAATAFYLRVTTEAE